MTAIKKAPSKKPTDKKPVEKKPVKKAKTVQAEPEYNKLEFTPAPKQTLLCVSQPIDWAEAFRRAAYDAGVPVAAWVGEACKRALPPAEQKKLSMRRSKGRPKSEK